jgi:hypothetical protein
VAELDPADPGTPSIEIVSGDDLEAALAAGGESPLPEALPVLPLRDMVTYPGTLTPLAVGQERSIRLIDDVLSGSRALVMVASREPEVDEPKPEQLHRVGVAGVVARMLKVPDGRARSGSSSASSCRPTPTSSRPSRSCPTSSRRARSCRP